jgi:glycosyltransferase involved in cell wall biosynthesis
VIPVTASVRPPRLTVALGPGNHIDYLLGQLSVRGLLSRVIRSWPRFSVDDWDDSASELKGVRRSGAYDNIVRGTWATWRHLPYLSRYRTPQTALAMLFDHLAAPNLGESDVFLGWSQMSLHSIRVAKRRGWVTVLEHPMLHVNTWQATMSDEYSRHEPRPPHFSSLMPRALTQRMRAEYDEADHIVLPSEVARSTFVQNGVSRERLVVLPLGVDTEFFRPGPPRHPGTLRVAFVGRLELLKGVQYLLEAWARLRPRVAHLTLAGALLPEMARVLARASLADSVSVVGPLGRDGVRALLQQSHVLVFPSICDAFGLSILEGMACGCCVVAASQSAGPEIIVDGLEGFVVPSRDAGALAERLEWLYLHQEACLEMGRRARLRVEDEYSLSRYGERLSETYLRIANRTPPQAPWREIHGFVSRPSR